MEKMFKQQILHGADYIDSRSRGSYRTWVKNRMKKIHLDVFNKSIWTDMKGNITKGKPSNT